MQLSASKLQTDKPKASDSATVRKQAPSGQIESQCECNCPQASFKRTNRKLVTVKLSASKLQTDKPKASDSEIVRKQAPNGQTEASAE
ncbi:hypothetical protein [Bacillus sp. T3]|uniref:hypothetical protein n=1 Tax=Bacillus sp. T3 TaxID=467262 RepID=UPI00298100B1|nr:hypothetical protein [Bacillus sp. T3]